MHIDEGLGLVLSKPGRAARACHGVPLIADPAGVEYEREFIIHRMSGRSRRCFDEPRSPIRMEEARVLEQTRGAEEVTVRDGPLHGLELIVVC